MGQRTGKVGGIDDMVLCYTGQRDKTSLMKLHEPTVAASDL